MGYTRSQIALVAWISLAASSCHAALPKIDFNRMGKVAVAGAFAGIDLYNDGSDPSIPTTSFDASTSSLFFRNPIEGSLTPIGSTNAGGVVSAGCALGDDTFYFAGNFDTISGVSARNIVAYQPSSRKFSEISTSGAPDGPISALYCDSENGQLWVGGSFDDAALLYTPSSNSWSATPFGGFSGSNDEVQSIIPSADQSSLIFSGAFITTFQGSSSTNNTIIRNPEVPESSGASPFSISLVPFPLSVTDNFDASPSSTRPGLGDIGAIFCPSGPDGPGNSWFAQDGFTAYLTLRPFKQRLAKGVRLGNTFFDGRSTTRFKVTSLPDNNVLTLRYTPPGTDDEETCQECPLSTDSSVSFQDFLFDGPPLFGVQIELSAWDGAGAGLHILQLLSDGAFGSAVAAENQGSCYSPITSSADLSGSWEEVEVQTEIPATTQQVLTTDVAVGSSSSPSVTWNLYVSSSGQYDVFMLIPGCTNMLDCGRRTSVDVTVSPGGSLSPVISTVSQRVTEDTQELIYSGPMFPTEGDFLVSVRMVLAAEPEGEGQGGQYSLVADRIRLELTSTDVSGDGSGGSGSSGNGRRGFGIFQWTLENDFGTINGTNSLPNVTETGFNVAAQQLFVQLGNSTSSVGSSSVSSVVAYDAETLFVAGQFELENGATNIASFNSGSFSSLPGSLNGTISSLVLYGNRLFVGGDFQMADTPSIRNIGQYDISTNQWSSLGGGVDGPVTDLNQVNGRLSVAGEFTRVLTSASGGPTAAGFASWDIVNGRWMNSGGLLVGQMSLVINATQSENGGEYISGNISAFRKFGADGMVSLENGDNGQAVITPLGAKLDGLASPSTSSSLRRVKRRWGINVHSLLTRQSEGDELPPSAPAPAPAVLAGTFWTNVTNSRQVTILGGNFSIPSTSAVNLGIYDPEDETITGLPGEQINGIVRSLLVIGNRLFVGGEFTVSGVSGEGFAVYDLFQGAWVTSTPGLQASSGTVIVRSITNIPSAPDTVIVAGTFASAASTQCPAICAYDNASGTWSTLGSGIDGDVSTVSYAGSARDLLVAAGTMTVGGGDAQVAIFSTGNDTWTALGELPGPVTAISVNDGNSSSVFAAGKSSGNLAPYVSHWDGVQWTTVDLGLSGDSNVTQLEFVPLSEEHGTQGVIQTNRMLWLSGSLSSSDHGDFSSALFDGETLYPYLVTSNANGEAGSVSSLFRSFSTFSFDARKFLARGIVILISIALGAGIVFLLCLIGILWTLFARRKDNTLGQDTIVEDESDMDSVRPSSLLAHVNAAARNTIIGTPANDEYYKKGVEHEGAAAAALLDRPETASQDGTYAAGEAIGVIDREHTPITVEDHDVNRPAQARYSFIGEGEGELPLNVGQDLIVLNDQDPSWWYVRDKNTMREGIVPASYLV